MAISAELDAYAREIEAAIMQRQNPIVGLLPASTAITAHGDYTDAWVRDGVYSILPVWAMALAYRKHDPDEAWGVEFEHATIKLMRGLLFCMMQQAPKVEAFKHTQDPLDALHAKFGTQTGDAVVDDDAWGHLQLDATSLFLLMLAQMTASGLQIIFGLDEVNFVQNLVYYIGRAYRTPDFGIWERGNKINKGKTELNASSVGMAKAAIEALNGLNLFGTRGSQASVIRILPDEIARSRLTLASLLPRESSSKETDAALLGAIGFPAFAVEDEALVARTREKIVNKLEGRYGCKRFLRDGHQTVLEDHNRLHYEPWELQQFEHIECEWPLFFGYLMLDAYFQGDRATGDDYYQRLEGLLVEQDGKKLLPELYYVPADKIDAERADPGSQERLPNENVPLVWAQSLYYLGGMIRKGLLEPSDLDPLGRRLQVGRQRRATVQVALIAEDEELQTLLANRGIATETPRQVEPVQLREADDLAAVYARVGRNEKFGLTGRPIRRLRSLTTSRVFRICGETIVFFPAFSDEEQFYLAFDQPFSIAQMKSEIAYIGQHWQDLGRPLVVLPLTWRLVTGESQEVLPELSELSLQLNAGDCDGTRVKLGRLSELLLTSSTERIDSLPGFTFREATVRDAAPRCSSLSHDLANSKPLSDTEAFWLGTETDPDRVRDRLQKSTNLYEQIELLQALTRLRGLSAGTGLGSAADIITVADLIEEVYEKAGEARYWAIVRSGAGLLDKNAVGLSDAVAEILVRGKQIVVGRAYSAASSIQQPLPRDELYAKICEFCREDIRDRVLTQEILIYLGLIVKAQPELIDGLLTLRIGYLILLLTSELAQELGVTQDVAYEQLMARSPSEIQQRLLRVLAGYESSDRLLQTQESLHLDLGETEERAIDWVVQPLEPAFATQSSDSWLRRRQLEGALGRIPKGFYPGVWQLLNHCQGLVIGDKLERRNRLDSKPIVAEMTPGEKNFALRIEHLLNKIEAPEYRQVNIEALVELSALVERNPKLQIAEYLVLDVIIGHGVRIAWLDGRPEGINRYNEEKSLAWQAFYERPPVECAEYIAKAFRFLVEAGVPISDCPRC